MDMQRTTYILENHVQILKYFIQLKYYTVNCLQHVCVCVCVGAFVFKIQIVSCINGRNHRVCMEMPMITC